MNSVRHTKVVATLGPASDALIDELVTTGVDVFRLNFSHGEHAEHERRITRIRASARAADRYVAILADLQGPKIRICSFAGGGPVTLEPGELFTIDTALASDAGSHERVGTTYRKLADEVRANDVLVLGDGLIELKVTDVSDGKVRTEVLAGGELAAKQGINKRGGGLSAPALTSKDLVDLAFACAHGVDYIAVSFPRDADDMRRARALIDAQGVSCGLVAKLERAETVASIPVLDEIIRASDAVMVARGDLGIEIGDAQLMGMQKLIIARARALNRPVITATQMMESMISSPRATRAEVMDVANAVLDGTDAVMLSGETAVGKYPAETVLSMISIILGAETHAEINVLYEAPPANCDTIDEAIAIAAMTAAEHLRGVRAVACLTATGTTPGLMSRMRGHLPIYALGSNPRTLARVALLRSVHPVLFTTDTLDDDAINDAAVHWLGQQGVVAPGDRVILSKGDYHDVHSGTNTLKIVVVPH